MLRMGWCLSMTIIRNNAKRLQLVAVWCILTAVFTAVAAIVPADGWFAFDWNSFFKQGWNVPPFYPPWTTMLVTRLSWPLLTGLTLSTFSIAVLQRASSLQTAVMAFFNLPLFWTIFLGQLDGLALLGVIGLPWLVPLALVKPQVASFAILSQLKAVKMAAVVLLLSLLIWGLWPLDLVSYHTDDQEAWPQDIALGWLGIPLFAILVWRMPKNNVDWWMLAGVTVTPFLMPYNLLPLMPAVARLPKRWAAAAAITSWLPLASNWVGPSAWYLGWLSVVIIGLGMACDCRT